MRDTFCAYYTSSKTITDYMVQTLDIKNGDRVLEPSVGEGDFIAAILDTGKRTLIDCLDINQEALGVVGERYKGNIVRESERLSEDDSVNRTLISIRHTDTLFDEELDGYSSAGGFYDVIVGNPPYGAWQDYEKRARLKKKYPGQYVKETYSLFLLRCISLLKMGGKLSFIIPDTFLYLNMHEQLRSILLQTTKIESILIFPSKFFPGISFGYSNLSIITLRRSPNADALTHTARIYTGFKDPSEFFTVASGSAQPVPSYVSQFRFPQQRILDNPQHRFILSDERMISLISSPQCVLGDVADVVTGFYSGNNKKYIRCSTRKIKGTSSYQPVDHAKIVESTDKDGVSGFDGCYIPYIKSAPKQRYLREDDDWFIKWDVPTVEHYKQDKKARYQNSEFYFATGVGMPMVKSKTIRAFLMEERLFDQSIVGIFPKSNDRRMLFYILGFMNSDIACDMIHLINPTANNSSNYIKSLPFVNPSDEVLSEISETVSSIIDCMKSGDADSAAALHSEVNKTICNLYSH